MVQVKTTQPCTVYSQLHFRGSRGEGNQVLEEHPQFAVVGAVRQSGQKYRAILYFQDESNVSLTAFLGKTWSPRGQTPRARVTGKRGGVAAMSAISKPGHLLFRLLEKRIASVEVIDFLSQILKHHPRRHLVGDR